MTEPMAPTVDSVREALRSHGADTEDCPALFDRVVAGVERRRRARRSIGAALVLAVLVGAIAVPGLGTGRPSSAVLGDSAVCPPAAERPSNASLRQAVGLEAADRGEGPDTCADGADPGPASVALSPTGASVATIGRQQSRRFDGDQP